MTPGRTCLNYEHFCRMFVSSDRSMELTHHPFICPTQRALNYYCVASATVSSLASRHCCRVEAASKLLFTQRKEMQSTCVEKENDLSKQWTFSPAGWLLQSRIDLVYAHERENPLFPHRSINHFTNRWLTHVAYLLLASSRRTPKDIWKDARQLIINKLA